MFYVPQLPCYKVYKKANHAMQIVWFENETSMGHFEQSCLGNFLIQFLEMDLTAYIKSLQRLGEGAQFNSDLVFKQGYGKTKEQLFDAADLLSDNLHLHRLLVSAMKNLLENEELSDMEQLKQAYLELIYIVQMYNQFSQGLAFCLNTDHLPDLSVAKKFALFIQSSKRFMTYKFQTGYIIAPLDKQGNLNFDVLQELGANEMDPPSQLDSIHEGKSGVSLVSFTWILSFEDLIFYDFLELVSRGLSVKRCKLCNRLFVLKSKHRAEYCDRKTENGRTCKQVGPKILFNATLDKPENTALKEYDRIRSLKQQQLERDRNKDADKAQATFDAWSKSAMVARAKFVAGEISEEVFLTEINKCQPLTAREEGNP